MRRSSFSSSSYFLLIWSYKEKKREREIEVIFFFSNILTFLIFFINLSKHSTHKWISFLVYLYTQLWFFFGSILEKKSLIEFQVLDCEILSKLKFGKLERYLVDQAKSIDCFLMAMEEQDSRLCLASILEDFIKQRNIQVSVGVDSSSKNADETCTSPVLSSLFGSFNVMKFRVCNWSLNMGRFIYGAL